MTQPTYRVGNHQPQNIYRGNDYIGVMFSADDAALVIAMMNSGHSTAIGLLGLVRSLRREGESDALTWAMFDQACEEYMTWRQRGEACNCGHDGLPEAFHLMPCPIAVRRFDRRMAEKRAHRADPNCAYPDGVCTCGEPEGHSCPCGAAGPDAACPVHHGRRARGPKPPPVGPGCVCDGSGRNCPRHGAVI